MKRIAGLFLAIVFAIAAVGAPSSARADSADTGTAIAAGLAIAVVGAYALVALQSDTERLSANTETDADLEQIMARAAERANSAPVSIEPVVDGSGSSIRGALVSLRTAF